MKSRVAKWKRYRKNIDKMAEKESSGFSLAMEESDTAAFKSLESSKNAIRMEGEEKENAVSYQNYVRARKRILFFKLSVLVAAVVGMLLFYFLWVR